MVLLDEFVAFLDQNHAALMKARNLAQLGPVPRHAIIDD